MIQASRPVEGYETMGFLEKMQSLQQAAPGWNGLVTALTYIWWLGTLITLIANARKRAAHDFIAGTVVLRTD
jgi:uncharacterized RDD family membrane protein YckC